MPWSKVQLIICYYNKHNFRGIEWSMRKWCISQNISPVSKSRHSKPKSRNLGLTARWTVSKSWTFIIRSRIFKQGSRMLLCFFERDYARAKQCARNQMRTSNCSLLAMAQQLNFKWLQSLLWRWSRSWGDRNWRVLWCQTLERRKQLRCDPSWHRAGLLVVCSLGYSKRVAKGKGGGGGHDPVSRTNFNKIRASHTVLTKFHE